MTRIVSFILFGLLLYNMLGLSIAYLIEKKYDTDSFSENYISTQPFSNAIVLKIPVPIPYQIDWHNPEQAEGKIRHKGAYYEMKTRQLINDTMYVHCEYDQNARDRLTFLASQIYDIGGIDHHSENKSPSKVLKAFLKEYMSLGRKYVFYLIDFCVADVFASDQYNSASTTVFLSVSSPPPDFI